LVLELLPEAEGETSEYELELGDPEMVGMCFFLLARQLQMLPWGETL